MEANAKINNAIYAELDERWYDANDDPVALLRAESRLRNPWVEVEIARALGSGPKRVLDIGCGAGFLSNHLAHAGHRVTGIDTAEQALRVAQRHDQTGTVTYKQADALSLPLSDNSFDVVCAMDFLEHISEPKKVIAEVSRVLVPGGLFFFHTFNRNPLAWLIVIKGVEWFVRNTPRHMHVIELFIKPDELRQMCHEHALGALRLVGTRPCIDSAFWRMLWSRSVPDHFSFKFTSSTLLAYSGVARSQKCAGSPRSSSQANTSRMLPLASAMLVSAAP